jgi:hypothetical protein
LHRRAFRRHHTNPATTPELEAKFVEFTSEVLPPNQVPDIVGMNSNLELLGDISALMAAVCR